MDTAAPVWGDVQHEDANDGHQNASLDPLQTAVQPAASARTPMTDYDDDEEFVYPAQETTGDTTEEYTDSFSYPGASASPSVVSPASPPAHQSEQPLSIPVPTEPAVPTPSPAQLEAIYGAASSGDMTQLRRLFRTAEEDQGIGAFALANDATSRTGLTPLHAACSRGHLEIARWLIEDCGAMADLEDKEGETGLHKAALNGHFDIVKYVLNLPLGKADVHAPDGDGYTALHNACSKGYLDVVRYLCEECGACDYVHSADGETLTPGVDLKSKGGWTPLMNAASKGHLPVVRYLLAKRSANPLVRNNWGETAFDIAAAVFEVYICEVLQQAELETWRKSNSTVPYNVLAVHTSVPVILYEHQRLDSRLKTLATNGGRPKFSAYHLGREGRRAPFELVLWGGESNAPAPSTPTSSSSAGSSNEVKKQHVAAWKSTVQLPSLEESFILPLPSASADSAPTGAERSHFWMSDWTLDVTDPRVDITGGWQYARVLDDPEDRWTAEQPAQLERFLAGSGLVHGMTSSTPSGSVQRSSSSSLLGPRGKGKGKAPANTQLSFARRRRWVRVMRRRLDIAPLPFLEPDGQLYSLAESGELIPYIAPAFDDASESGGVELSSASMNVLSKHSDYVARARYLAGSKDSNRNGGGGSPYVDPQSLAPADLKRNINKLSRAVSELRLGILNDGDVDRKTQAEVLINTYNRELERTRLAASSQGIFLTAEDDNIDEAEEDDGSDGDSFHYPGSSTPTPGTPRPASIRSYHTDYFSLARPRTSSVSSFSRPADLTPALSQAAEFRVPTHDAPQKVISPRANAPVPHSMHSTWERDASVSECRTCRKRFTFYFRKHCRRCGKVFCNNCSSHRALLDRSEVVTDPTAPLVSEERRPVASMQRVCQPCYDEVNVDAPGPLRSSRGTGLEGVMVSEASLAVPAHMRRGEESSQISDLADCPVCGQNLADVGPAALQERHVRDCLDGGSGPGASQAAKYIVYKLPVESVLIGTECVICLEEFEKSTLVARLSCLCTFHNHCLSSWLQRGHACPVHARDQ
ncbi:hypothetical protein DL93DRAFT_2097093 [Clavulina sp. PMI_390]|nr:hypothetical protein DL93DRAFT_2097093 [Clavulina sp. PMI_390]